MSLIPFVLQGEYRTVVTTPTEYRESGGSTGFMICIRNLDIDQLTDTESGNASYDLRIGNSYKLDKHAIGLPLKDKEEFILDPNSSVIIETMESVNFPETRFGHIVPKVKLLQKGISNTSSKIDPGYDGFLLVTLFNLGKKPVSLKRGDKFCSLYVIEVGKGVIPYDKPEQKQPTTGSQTFWAKLVDFGERRSTFLNVLLTVVTLLATFANIAVLVQQFQKTQQSTPSQLPTAPSQPQQKQPLP
ncbi:dCTP deaminase domain-containing protein [Nodosilinea nodulosa]|uniref:dCTP deaminase domain-containing protein n=1 Tax=Nodosilinea nodulosa TaxID=416001 RepID=UPI000A013F56|nr:hypothetical protein [Nodosilinea nodulosa]